MSRGTRCQVRGKIAVNGVYSDEYSTPLLLTILILIILSGTTTFLVPVRSTGSLVPVSVKQGKMRRERAWKCFRLETAFFAVEARDVNASRGAEVPVACLCL